MFVLVKIVIENKRPTSSNSERKFPYVGICKSHADNEEDVKITFLKVSGYIKKSSDLMKCLFVLYNLSSWSANLPSPDIKSQANGLCYDLEQI